MNKLKILSSNSLKIIAMIIMVIDHIGAILFPDITILRIIGRLSFPIFAFMIAEGCKYTRNKLRYFLTVSIFALVYELVNIFIFDTEMNIFLTFSLSIIMIYSLSWVKKTLTATEKSFIKQILSISLFFISVISIYVLTLFYTIDYGFWGCLIPVLVSLFHQDKDANNFFKKFDNHIVSTIMLAIGLIILAHSPDFLYQWYALISVIPILLYSEKRGKLKLKYLFYIFYPAHIFLLYGLQYLFF